MGLPPSLADLLFPSRDVSFGAIVRELSQRETGPPADNLISNEDSYPRVADEVARLCPPDGVYLGVGPDQNFTLLAHAKPKLAFVMDYRRRNLLLHLLHKAIFTLCGDRVDYLSRLTARAPGRLASNPSAEELVAAFVEARFDRERLKQSVADVVGVLKPLGVVAESEWADLATIQAKLAGPGMKARFLALPMYPTFGRLITTRDRRGQPAHLLASEERYRFVRDLQRGDRLIPLVGDFGSPLGLTRLGDWLRARSFRLSLVYVSDVEFFLIRAGRFEAYAEHLARLPLGRGRTIGPDEYPRDRPSRPGAGR